MKRNKLTMCLGFCVCFFSTTFIAFSMEDHLCKHECGMNIYADSITLENEENIEFEDNQTNTVLQETEVSLPNSIILDVAPINQHDAGLKYGCESMATLMALEYVTKIDFDNYEFGINIPMDTTEVKTTNGYYGVYEWGNPSNGFVGDITGEEMGSTIYPAPLVNHLQSMGYNAIDLSGSDLETILSEVKKGNPVVAWVSLYMNTPNDFSYWTTLDGEDVRVTFSAHSITITGVDDTYVYYNDPFTGSKNQKIEKSIFEEVYNWRGKMALVIK